MIAARIAFAIASGYEICDEDVLRFDERAPGLWWPARDRVANLMSQPTEAGTLRHGTG